MLRARAHCGGGCRRPCRAPRAPCAAQTRRGGLRLGHGAGGPAHGGWPRLLPHLRAGPAGP
eukprot:11200542-Lingulodinium_polyedra.AAC.1